MTEFREDQRQNAGRADGICQSDRGDGLRYICRGGTRRRRRWRAGRRLSARGSGASFRELLAQHEIDMIFLLAPTTHGRAFKEVARYAPRLHLLRIAARGNRRGAILILTTMSPQDSANPCAYQASDRRGFRHPRCARRRRRVAKVADAVVIGSRLVQEMETSRARRVLDNIARSGQGYPRARSTRLKRSTA